MSCMLPLPRGVVSLCGICLSTACSFLPFAQDESTRKNERKRDMIKTEVVSSERTYVSSLQTLIEVYLKPLQSRDKQHALGLTDQMVHRLFANVEVRPLFASFVCVCSPFL